MKKILMVFFAAVLGMCIVTGGFVSAYAQEEEPEAFTLEEIKVTAEKREVNVQDLAMSVSAITGAKITERAVADFKGALNSLAGVNILGIPQGGQVFIRGVGSTIDTNFANPSVSIQVDNIFVGKSEAMFLSMYDVDRVEVLRGPQGTIYGQNAAGGQINLISKRPGDEFEASTTITIGDYNLKNLQAVLNVPMGEKVSTRLAMNREDRDGYISDGSDNSNKFAGRMRLAYNPTSALSILATVEYTHDRSSPANTVPVPGSAGNLPLMENRPGRDGSPPATPWSWAVPDADGDGVGDDVYDPDAEAPAGPPGTPAPDTPNGIPDIVDTGWELPMGGDEWSQDAYHPEPYNDLEFKFYQVEIDYDMGWGSIYLLPTYNENKRVLWSELLFGTSQGGDLMTQPWKEEQMTMDARLQSPDDVRLTWIVGAYWRDSDNQDINPAGATTLTLLEQSAEQNEWVTQSYRRPEDTFAYYGQTTFSATDRFRLTGGVRFNTDNRKQGYRFANYDITDPTDSYYDLATVTADGRHEYDSGVLEYEDSQDDISYKGGVEFDLTDESLLYTFFSTGFKSGGLNMGYPVTTFEPEENISYSVGSKNRFMDNRLQLNLEAYYYDYDNYQVQVSGEAINPLTGQPGFVQRVENSGPSDYHGLELETQWLATANDLIDFSIAYMSAEFGELTVGPNPIGGLTTDYTLTGHEMPFSPTYSGILGYEHTFKLNDGGEMTTRAQMEYSDGYYATHEVYLAGAYQESFQLFDVYLNYRAPSGKYSANIWAKNIANEAVTARVLPVYRRQLRSPRTVGLTISANF